MLDGRAGLDGLLDQLRERDSDVVQSPISFIVRRQHCLVNRVLTAATTGIQIALFMFQCLVDTTILVDLHVVVCRRSEAFPGKCGQFSYLVDDNEHSLGEWP